jgi:hypothetical protein
MSLLFRQEWVPQLVKWTSFNLAGNDRISVRLLPRKGNLPQ